LSDDEIIKCCDLYGISGVDYISLSTGIDRTNTSGEKAGLVRKHLADAVGIKLSGIFENEEETEALIAAGASRIGRFI
jgi:deoxyribose-phosphate aldolase